MQELKINPKLYPLETIYSAAYVFLDKAFIRLDGDPEKEIIVTIKPRDETQSNLGEEFMNELINYADYKQRAQDTKKIREMLLQRALLTNDPSAVDFDDILEELDDELEDPDEIAIPWEDKYDDSKQ